MYRTMFTVILALFSMFVSTALAQIPGQPYRIDDKEVRNLIRRIEQQSDKFRGSLDSALDKSRFNGSTREDDINSFVKDFYEQTKHLHDQFEHHKSTAPDVQTVLDRASRIDGFMRRYPLTRRAQEDWAGVKTYLNDLAGAYNVGWQWAGYPGGAPISEVPYRISDKEVEQVIRRIEKQSDKFRTALDSALDKSRLDGTRQEDDINTFVKNFYEETKKLREHFDAHKSTSADVQSVLDRASQIDQFLRRNRLRRRDAEKDWSTLKVNLAELAQVYNVPWQWRY
jgi:multidrug efflux pump subunit AcrA (membrane-fusion protein)